MLRYRFDRDASSIEMAEQIRRMSTTVSVLCAELRATCQRLEFLEEENAALRAEVVRLVAQGAMNMEK